MKLRRAASDFLLEVRWLSAVAVFAIELVVVTIPVIDLSLVWELGVAGALTLAHTHADTPHIISSGCSDLPWPTYLELSTGRFGTR